MAKTPEKADGRRKYPEGISRMERRRLRALGKLEAQGVNVTQQKEDTRSDAEVLKDMVERMGMLRQLTEAAAKGQIPSITVPGAPGIGKTHNTEDVLNAIGATWTRVNGTISAIELYKLAFEYRFRGNVIVIDDGDAVFKDEESMNLVKAMTDSHKKRMLNWRTNSEFLQDVDTYFEYQGSLIILSNVDFQAYVDAGRGRNVAHMEALISRTLYLDLKIHHRRAISLWINHVCTEGHMFEQHGIDAKTGKQVLEWLHEHHGDLREYSLRTVVKLCGLTKIGTNWQNAAKYTVLR
jgi:hypothetical protein